MLAVFMNLLYNETVEKFIICITILVSAFILSFGMSGIGRETRSVTVRGLSEREVDADLVVWPLSFTVGSDDLNLLRKEIISKNDVCVEFLKEHGLDDSDFMVQAPQIQDNSVNPYIDRDRISYKYIAQSKILIRSNKINEVKAAQNDSLNLAEKGIAVRQEYDSKMQFEFTKLNDIKPEMIAEATKNARLAAEQFAHDSESRVGKIKKATQGLFSIEDAAIGLEEKKHIRVVTSVEYLLK